MATEIALGGALDSFEIDRISLPLDNPIRVPDRPPIVGVNCMIATARAGGDVGRSYVFTLDVDAAPVLHDLIRILAPHAAASGGDDPRAAWSDTYAAAVAQFGEGKIVCQAVAGIDIACWDLHCRRRGEALWQVLGATGDPIGVYAGALFSVMGRDPYEAQAEAAEYWLARGFTAMKVRVGRDDPESERALIGDLRRRHPEATLLSDANRGWTLEEALAALPWLEELGIQWLEDPLHSYDIDAYRRLREASSIPIVAGEYTHYGEWSRHLIDAGVCDYFMLDLQHQAGITGWLEQAERVRAAGLKVVPHLFPEVNAQLVAACRDWAGLLSYSRWWESLLDSTFAVENGLYAPPETPGVGLSFRADIAGDR
jgi:L-alanine-DL-glutamate epimerase-like enolase superfamily enzyme